MVRARLKRMVEARFTEVGWTDEARAAAAVARKHGYSQASRGRAISSGATRDFIHANGTLHIGANGQWEHVPTPGTPGAIRSGTGSAELGEHLDNIHGEPRPVQRFGRMSGAMTTGKAPGTPSPAGFKGYEAEARFVNRPRFVEARFIEIGWTDAARQAAQAVRARVGQAVKKVDVAGARLYDKTRDLIQGATKDHYAIDVVPSHAQQRINAGWPPPKPEAEAEAGYKGSYEQRPSGSHMGAPDSSGSVGRISAAEREGGPGSGRRPGGGVKYGHGANTPAAQKAVGRGWKPTASEHGTQYYEHPDKPGHTLAIHNDGTANVYGPRQAEAAGVSGLAQVTRSGAKPVEARLVATGEDEHDEDVPMDSFKSDLERKKSLRQVMGKPGDHEEPHDQEDEGILDALFGDDDCPDDEKDADGNCPGSDDFDPDTRGQYTAEAEDEQDEDAGKQDKEDVNYRYSPDPSKTCGGCRFFQEPGACQKVSGLIRKIDVCDLFQPKTAEAKKGGVVQARMVSTEDEKTPPGGEDVVRALKKKSGVDEPYAVAWAMYNRGEI